MSQQRPEEAELVERAIEKTAEELKNMPVEELADNPEMIDEVIEGLGGDLTTDQQFAADFFKGMDPKKRAAMLDAAKGGDLDAVANVLRGGSAMPGGTVNGTKRNKNKAKAARKARKRNKKK